MSNLENYIRVTVRDFIPSSKITEKNPVFNNLLFCCIAFSRFTYTYIAIIRL